MSNCSCLRVSPPPCPVNLNCPDKYGCFPNVCPDFVIKQHDTLPILKYEVTDEEGNPIDLTGKVVEASMWWNGKLRKDITASTTEFRFSHDVGFYQALQDDIIIVDTPRSPEHMLVTSFDEANKTITVERGINGTIPMSYKKNTSMKGFRFMGSPGATEMILENQTQIDGTVYCDQLVGSFLTYTFDSTGTCSKGCFCFEFKLLTMDPNSITIPSVIPQCFIGVGVTAVERYPKCGQLLIKICESPTAEV